MIASACYGTGLGLMFPALHLLLNRTPSLDPIPTGQPFWLVLPGSSQQAVFRLVRHLPGDPFWSFIAIMALVAFIQTLGGAARYVHEKQAATVLLQAIMVWRERIFGRLVRLPMTEIMAVGRADNTSRLLSDTGVLFTGYKALIGAPLLEILKGVAGLLVAIVLDWRLCLVAVGTAPLIVFCAKGLSDSIRGASRRALQQFGRLLGTVQESLLGIVVVKACNGEEREQQRFEKINRELFAEETSIARTKAAVGSVVEIVSTLMVVSIASVAAWYVFRRNSDPANLITVLVALTAAAQGLRPLGRMSHELAEADAAASRLLEVMQLPVEPIRSNRSPDAPALLRHRRQITFEALSFSYPGRERPALAGVTFSVPFGRTVAIVGANGAGKTTLLNLLLRLYSPSAGRILIDGVDIAGVSLRSLRGQIALVPQENGLFRGTVAENIAYGMAGPPLEEITRAAQAAYAHEFIVGLPGGYDTELGEFGSGLSSGQRQRLAIARAILRDPAILVLDEATSQIETDSESRIREALWNLRGRRTIFVVAHRLRFAQDADLTVVLDGGKVVDMGKHDDLMDRCVLYRDLAGDGLGSVDPGGENRVSGAGVCVLE